jgi:hypothetical protein
VIQTAKAVVVLVMNCPAKGPGPGHHASHPWKLPGSYIVIYYILPLTQARNLGIEESKPPLTLTLRPSTAYRVQVLINRPLGAEISHRK